MQAVQGLKPVGYQPTAPPARANAHGIYDLAERLGRFGSVPARHPLAIGALASLTTSALCFLTVTASTRGGGLAVKKAGRPFARLHSSAAGEGIANGLAHTGTCPEAVGRCASLIASADLKEHFKIL